MKKILILGLVLISTVVFSHMYGGYGHMRSGYGMQGGHGTGSRMYQTLTPDQQEKLNLLENELYKTRSLYMTDIQTKQLEVERLILQDNVEWKKVEKLNEEISRLRAKMATETMKHQKKIADIAGNDYYMHGNMRQGHNYGNCGGRMW